MQSKSKVIHPPHSLIIEGKSVFLAGSIEMGKAIDWQQEVIQSLATYPITILNPRRPDWDSSWVESIENPNFHEQVQWELEAQEQADYIIMYFAPTTKSPISLLELGLFAKTGKMIVCCPDGFWKKGNVDVVCQRYQIPQAKNLETLITMLIQQLLGIEK